MNGGELHFHPVKKLAWRVVFAGCHKPADQFVCVFRCVCLRGCLGTILIGTYSETSN